MKREHQSNTSRFWSTAQNLLLGKNSGRLIALLVFLSVIAMVGASLSSATSTKPLPVNLSRADSSSDATRATDLLAAPSLLSKFEATTGAEPKTSDQTKSKATSKIKRGASKLPSKTVRGGRSKESNTAKGNKASVTAQSQIDQNASSKVTTYRNALGQTVYSIAPSNFDVSPPLTELSRMVTEDNAVEEHPELQFPAWRIPRSDQPDPVVQIAPSLSRAGLGPILSAPTTGFNFVGVPGSSGFPPDTNGSVGNDQYVETVNTRYQVWTLNRGTNTVTSLLGPSSINTLWAAFGGACQTQNAGDPIVLFDKLANRWLITQFTSTASGGNYFQCVAVSTTANAAGTYNRYAFTVPSGRFGDYPHFGLWTDAYYMMAHAFTSASGGSYVGAIFAAIDRTKLLAGDPTATWQVIIDPAEGGHVPADIDGFTPPPGGAPGIFVSLHSAGMYLYRMKVDFATPANTARTLQAIIPTAAATAACGGANCIPQPGSGTLLDSLADRLMARLAYRNFVDHESLVVSHSVDPSVTGLVSGVRWYDFRISGQPNATCPSYPCLYQQGTIADVANGRSRWMPSIAMDGSENILVGYSTTGKTNGSENHSIRYTGRAKSDPPGTMTAPETTIINGTRNITTNRWGDYSSLSIDPADDCTFWHANEYYAGLTGNSNWKTQVASARYPEGSGAGQCLSQTCTNRPVDAPVIGSASATGDNQITVTWTGITPTPGSYAIERAIGPVGSEGLYQPLASVAGGQTSYVDTSVQGGLTYSYRVLAASDGAAKCQALVRSGSASATATGSCNLKPVFAGASSASSSDDPTCGVTINWTPATSSCPLAPTVSYNVFRGTTPNFVPSGANRIATCVPGPSSYVDSDHLLSGVTYYYVVRAEDGTTGNGGECAGGNEESNSIVVSGTAYGPGLQAGTGTWTDGGGDGTAFLQLNAGGGADPIWRFVNSTNDSGANHTPGGSFAYRNAGPGASAHYSDNACAIAQTPVLNVGSTSINLTYWERHQLEKGWDGVVVEYSLNGGAWTTVPTPSNATADGCLVSDITTDWATLGCTGAPPANACAYPATQVAITGPVGSGTSCTNWVTGNLTAYGRRCHLLTGLTPGDTIQIRWKMTSDSSANFAGFYLDDIGVSNIRLPNSCATATTLTAAPATGTYGGTANLSATLTLSGSPISGKTINFSLNGNSVGSAVTDGSGVASLANASLAGINAGSYPTGVGASYAGDGNYLASNGSAALTVNQATPVITWNNPADIIYGTALSGTQLNATADTPGSFVYTPAAGTVLASGNGQNLHTDFTPADTTNYTNASKNVSINVLSAVLHVTKTADRNPAPVELNLNYNLTITNTGNASATNVVLSDVLSSIVTFTAATSSQGTCSYNSVNRTVTCNFGTIAATGSASVQITVKPRSEGTLNNTATITAGQWDPATGNNSASANGIPAVKQTDLSIQKTSSPTPIFVGQNTTYTIVVKNLSTVIGATGVVMTDSLPASMKFVSATTSQGSLITPPVGSTGVVTANVGALGIGAMATVTITVQSTVDGVIANTGSVSGNEQDPAAGNNTATATTTVNAAGLQKVLLARQVLTGGCENTTGNVYLTGPAPPGGLTVSLSTTNLAGVTVPASVFIPFGQTVSPAFNVTTSPVVTKQVGLVNAGTGPGMVSRNLTINVGSGSCPP